MCILGFMFYKYANAAAQTIVTTNQLFFYKLNYLVANYKLIIKLMV